MLENKCNSICSNCWKKVYLEDDFTFSCKNCGETYNISLSFNRVCLACFYPLVLFNHSVFAHFCCSNPLCYEYKYNTLQGGIKEIVWQDNIVAYCEYKEIFILANIDNYVSKFSNKKITNHFKKVLKNLDQKNILSSVGNILS